MRNKTYTVIVVVTLASIFSITSWAYWKEELNVKINVPFVYNVDLVVSEEVENKENLVEESIDITQIQEDIVIVPDEKKENFKDNDEGIVKENTTKEIVEETIEENQKENIVENGTEIEKR